MTCWRPVMRTGFDRGLPHGWRSGRGRAWPTVMEGVPRVDKIVGPGNLFVALAKRLVSSATSISTRSLAPARSSCSPMRPRSPDYAAADLLAQAEHAPGVSVLVSWDEPTIQAIAAGRRRSSWAIWNALTWRGRVSTSSPCAFSHVMPRKPATSRTSWHPNTSTLLWTMRGEFGGPHLEGRCDVCGSLALRSRWATTWRGRRTCCPPAGQLGGPAACPRPASLRSW